MELHRLKVMQEGYDTELFNRLYSLTENLRTILTSQIDSRRFGVTSDIIKSWFDDKFIFVFNKYYGTMDENQLRGYLINSLRTFKFRMLRGAYHKSNMYNDSIRIDDYTNFINIIPIEEDMDDYSKLLSLALQFLKKKLSSNAFVILDIDLNPPPYISSKLESSKTKIPAKLIAEYLDLEEGYDSIYYINNLRKEISNNIESAKNHFKGITLQKMIG